MLRRKLFSDQNSEEINTDNKKLKTEDNNQGGNGPCYSITFVQGISDLVLQLQVKLNNELNAVNFLSRKVKYVYNPLEYASKPNENYVRKYATSAKKVLFFGMNPGPFGMCQTGIPFGDVPSVRDFLKIEGLVNKPEKECPFRPILGFACSRREQSGMRFWACLEKLCQTPERFFENCFVLNYCPLAFMKENGCNVTPRELEINTRKQLENLCDDSFFNLISILKPELIIPIGEYCETRLHHIFKSRLVQPPKILRLSHPSPRSLNNQNWPEKAEQFFKANNITQYFN